MNLVRFLSAVDECTSTMSPEEFSWFVHETARTLPEEMRDDFLSRLRLGGKPSADKKILDNKTLRELKKKTTRAQRLLKAVKTGELYIWAEYNENWDEWDDDDDDEFVYIDSDGMMEEILEVIRHVHRLVDVEEYEEALRLGMEIIDLRITIQNQDYDDTISLDDAFSLLDIDFTGELKRLALETMLCAYHCAPSSLDDIYHVLTGVPSIHLRLEDLFQFSPEELKDQDTFLGEWTDYLGKVKDQKSSGFYVEALGLLPDPKERMEKVKAYAGTHPEGYLPLLEDPEISVQERFELGMDGLARVKARWALQDIALDTADLAILTNQGEDVTESCWMEAFVSDPTPTNYLRVLLNSRDLKSCKEEMERQYSRFCGARGKGHGKNSDPGILFLMGNFKDVFETYLRPKKFLGWTGTFVKTGFALYLALLYRGTSSAPAICAMTNMARRGLEFVSKEYSRGLPHWDSEDERFEFPIVFDQWKDSVLLPDSALTEEILSSMEKTMEKRVAAICQKNRRKYYGECADFLGAIGEVRESQGQVGEKQRILDACAKKYPSRRNLISELRRVGWIAPVKAKSKK